MAREIESVHEFEEQAHPYALAKDVTVVRCGDGAVYEFVLPEDEPLARLRRRFKDDGEMSLSSAQLPNSVEALANDVFGENSWRK